MTLAKPSVGAPPNPQFKEKIIQVVQFEMNNSEMNKVPGIILQCSAQEDFFHDSVKIDLHSSHSWFMLPSAVLVEEQIVNCLFFMQLFSSSSKLLSTYSRKRSYSLFMWFMYFTVILGKKQELQNVLEDIHSCFSVLFPFQIINPFEFLMDS